MIIYSFKIITLIALVNMYGIGELYGIGEYVTAYNVISEIDEWISFSIELCVLFGFILCTFFV